MKTLSNGFTLIELAIVLLIIGLIAGGIMAGSGMIRNSEVQSVGQDLLKYETAIHHFKSLYDALPGDFATATQQWGILAGDGSDVTCITTEAVNTKATCNGNGDGWINGEQFRAWQHMANADIISGPYTGSPNGFGVDNALAGKNAPGSRAGGVYRIVPISPHAATIGWFSLPSGHYFELGANGNGTKMPLTPAEAFMIDRKFDDGKPSRGRIQSVRKSIPTTANCTTSDDEADAEYDATNTSASCPIRSRIPLKQ